MRRVVAVSPLAGMAGGETALIRLLPALAELGWSPLLTVPRAGELRAAASDCGIPVRRLPLGPPERRTPASYVGVALAPVALRGAQVAFLNGLPAQRVVWTLRAPALVRVNNPLDEPPRAWARPGFWRRVRALLADSEAVAQACLAAGAPRDRVHAAYPPAWGGAAPPAARDGGPGRGRVAFVGQIEPRKGVAELVEAAGAFLDGRPGASLAVIGRAPRRHRRYEQTVREAARRSPAGSRIRFDGFRPGAAAAMAEFDVVAVPSLAEPFGTVAAEAAAAGVPVVASRVGGLEEVVEDGETGLLVPPGDPAALAQAVGALLDDPQRGRALGRRAREAALRRFSPQAYAERVGALLERAVEEGVR